MKILITIISMLIFSNLSYAKSGTDPTYFLLPFGKVVYGDTHDESIQNALDLKSTLENDFALGRKSTILAEAKGWNSEIQRCSKISFPDNELSTLKIIKVNDNKATYKTRINVALSGCF